MKDISTRIRKWSAVLAMATALSACADYTNQRALNNPDGEMDSMEGFNRAMFGVNTTLDHVIIRPVTVVYRTVVPETGRTGVSNFLRNLYSPVTFANSVMQGDQENSFATFWRFVINTTIGLGGLIDVAESAGLKNRSADFGQTMAVWGVNSGPYLVLPILGPGTVRDQFGFGVDVLINPVTWSHEDWHTIAQGGMTMIDKRSTNFTAIDDLYKTSLDPYAAFRSGYLQRRTREITIAKRPSTETKVPEKAVAPKK